MCGALLFLPLLLRPGAPGFVPQHGPGHPRDGHTLAPRHRSHHRTGALEVLEESVDVGGRGSGARRDPLAPGPTDDSGIPALVVGHGQDDRLRTTDLTGV